MSEMQDKLGDKTKIENRQVAGIEFKGEIERLNAEVARLTQQNQALKQQSSLSFTEQLMDQLGKIDSDKQLASMSSQILRAIHGIVYIYDISAQKLLFINTSDGFAGYSKAEIESYDAAALLDIIHPEDAERMGSKTAVRLQTMSKGEAVSLDFRIKSPTGEWLWLNTREVSTSLDDNGKVETYLGVVQDITELRKTQKKLDEQRHFIDSINSTVPSFIYVNNIVEDRSVYANPELAELLGYTEEEWLKVNRQDLLHPSDSEIVDSMTNQLENADDGQVIESEFRLRHKAGHWKWLHFSDKVFTRDEDGSVREIIGSASDITALRNTMEQYRKSRLLYRSIAQNLPNGYVLLFNKGMECVLAEGALLKKLGYKNDQPSQFEGKRLPDGRSWMLFQRQFRDAIAGRKLSFEAQHGENYFLVHLAPVYNDSGEVYAVMNITLDITTLKRTQRELEANINTMAQAKKKLESYIASNLELEQFAYIASHDLKEPIRTIISFSQLLEMKFNHILDQDAKDYMQYIVEGALRMQDLINGLLSYSRVETEGLPFERLDMNKVVEEVLSDLNRQIQEKEVEVIYSELPDIMGDRTQVNQLVQNLISNGIKFNRSERAEIEIDSMCKDDFWHFSVRDNGIGIEPQDFDRIFGIFKRLHTREEYEGAGIGLSVCRRILERHGGKIWIDSEFGKGTTFHFSIPRRVEI